MRMGRRLFRYVSRVNYEESKLAVPLQIKRIVMATEPLRLRAIVKLFRIGRFTKFYKKDVNRKKAQWNKNMRQYWHWLSISIKLDMSIVYFNINAMFERRK